MACHGLPVWSLHMSYCLSHGYHGTMPCSSDHREAAGPVEQAADLVLSFVVTQQAHFARFVTASVGHPAVPHQRGTVNVHMSFYACFTQAYAMWALSGMHCIMC